MSLEKTVSVVFLARTLRATVATVGLIVFIHLLGAHVFGVFVLFEAILTVGGLVVNAGINDAVEKRLSETKDPRILSTALFLKAIALGPVIALIIALEPVLNSYFSAELAIWLIPAIICRQTGRISLNALRGELRVSEATILELIEQLAFVGFGVLLIISGYDVISLPAAFLFSWTTVSAIALSRMQIPIAAPSLEVAQSLFDFAKYNLVASLLTGSVYNWTDTLVLGFFVSPAAVAAYEAVWRVSAAVMLLSGSIATTIFPHVSNNDTRKQHEDTEELVPKALFWSVLLVIPSLIGVTIIGDSLLTIIFDDTIAMAATALTILMIGRLAEAGHQVIGRVLLAIDQPRLIAQSTIVFLILNLSMNALLVQIFGLDGAAIATALSMVVFTGMNAKYLSRYITIRVPVFALGSCVLAAILMGGTLAIVVMMMEIVTILHLISVVLGAGVLYIVILMLLPPTARILPIKLLY